MMIKSLNAFFVYKTNIFPAIFFCLKHDDFSIN